MDKYLFSKRWTPADLPPWCLTNLLWKLQRGIEHRPIVRTQRPVSLQGEGPSILRALPSFVRPAVCFSEAEPDQPNAAAEAAAAALQEAIRKLQAAASAFAALPFEARPTAMCQSLRHAVLHADTLLHRRTSVDVAPNHQLSAVSDFWVSAPVNNPPGANAAAAPQVVFAGELNPVDPNGAVNTCGRGGSPAARGGRGRRGSCRGGRGSLSTHGGRGARGGRGGRGGLGGSTPHCESYDDADGDYMEEEVDQRPASQRTRQDSFFATVTPKRSQDSELDNVFDVDFVLGPDEDREKVSSESSVSTRSSRKGQVLDTRHMLRTQLEDLQAALPESTPRLTSSVEKAVKKVWQQARALFEPGNMFVDDNHLSKEYYDKTDLCWDEENVAETVADLQRLLNELLYLFDEKFPEGSLKRL
eukprot:TRINITY_DN272_c0_g1_i1.p2 TRINITY_DN272_c0_g1~~TRINITY_DN272_c0_g1_i1.p2  ORF type:complete len:416 (+),score=53.93 TRINITY_DN272_c0_g1_i1:4280-5527(+)